MSDSSKSLFSSSGSLGKEVAVLISNGLLQCPDLISELPSFLVALENGKQVKLETISSVSGREIVEKLYELIPKLADEFNTDLKSIRKLLLNSFLDCRCIVQPKKLSASESLSAKSALLLLDLVSRFPSLKSELGGLFRSVLMQEKDARASCTGCVIDISGIGNDDIEEGVGKLFTSLGLNEIGFDERKYELPATRTDKRSDCVGAIKNICNVLAMYEASCVPEAQSAVRTSVASGDGRSRNVSHEWESSRPMSSHSDSDSDSDSDSPTKSKSKFSLIGPAMPSAEQLLSAQQAVSVDSDSEDEYGPQMRGPAIPRPMLSAALGTDAYDRETKVTAVGSTNAVNFTADGDGAIAIASASDGKTVREEWMMVPGEHDLFGSAISRGDVAGALVNRGFQTGKLAKKAAEAVEAYKEESQAEYAREHSEEHAATQALLEEYRLARGPSLMEAHLKKLKSGGHKRGRGGGGGDGFPKKERRGFDRDDDVLPRAKLTARDADEMVQDAKQLDSRFSKGTVQKSF